MTSQFKFRGIGSNRRLTTRAARLSKALLATFVIVTAMPVAGGDAGCPPLSGAMPEPGPGQFTGKFVNGAPVYRLSSITVSASRTAERPVAEHRERLTRAEQARPRVVAKPPA